MFKVELLPALPSELHRIENMMQFYMYDFSEWLPLQFGEEGWFPVSPKAAYWAKPGTEPYFVVVDGETAGFVTVDDEVVCTDTEFNIGYFFIGKRFRGNGVGKLAMSQLLARYPGSWQIFHINSNRDAAAFWKRIIPLLASAPCSIQDAQIDGYDCTLYKFAASKADPIHLQAE